MARLRRGTRARKLHHSLAECEAHRLADFLHRMAAQLARTEEAAKRILTRSDPSARGGTAAALLQAESQLAASREEVARLQHELAV